MGEAGRSRRGDGGEVIDAGGRVGRAREESVEGLYEGVDVSLNAIVERARWCLERK